MTPKEKESIIAQFLAPDHDPYRNWAPMSEYKRWFSAHSKCPPSHVELHPELWNNKHLSKFVEGYRTFQARKSNERNMDNFNWQDSAWTQIEGCERPVSDKKAENTEDVGDADSMAHQQHKQFMDYLEHTKQAGTTTRRRRRHKTEPEQPRTSQ